MTVPLPSLRRHILRRPNSRGSPHGGLAGPSHRNRLRHCYHPNGLRIGECYVVMEVVGFGEEARKPESSARRLSSWVSKVRILLLTQRGLHETFCRESNHEVSARPCSLDSSRGCLRGGTSSRPTQT